MRSVPAPWRATDSEPQASQRSGTRSRWPQWWQAIAFSARCSTSATSQLRALPDLPAGAAGEEVRPAAAVEQHDRLARARERAARLGVQRVAGAAHVEHAHGRQRARVDAVRAACRCGERVPGLRARRGGADEQPGAGAARALGGDGAGVVARVALVLVGGVVLLVDDDQPEVGDRREDRRARADRDPRLAGAQPPPLVVALALAERGVQQRDGVAEAGLEAPDGLRRQRDLGHEHDHALPALERRGGGAQVDLGLARAGDAVQQVRCARRALDGRDRGLLVGRELDGRARLDVGARRAAALARRSIATSPRASRRRSAGSCARGAHRQRVQQRALVVGEPLPVERRVRAERPRLGARLARAGAARAAARAPASSSTPSAIHSASSTRSAGTSSSRTPVGATSRSGASSDVLGEPDHDAVERLAAERHPHDRADPHGLLGQRVVERAAQAARRRERLDPGDHGPRRR